MNWWNIELSNFKIMLSFLFCFSGFSFSFFLWIWNLSPIFLVVSDFNTILWNDQVVWKSTFNEQSWNEGRWTQQQAQQVFVEWKFNSLHWFTSVFDHGQLNDDGSNQNNQEKWVVEEVFKDVGFLWLKFSGVDFIEDLKQDENVEEDAVMFTSFLIPVSSLDWWWNSENFRT